MSNYETIKVSKNGSVTKITIDRPKALNALNPQVIDELQRAIDQLDHSTRIVHICGAGEKAFVAGADISVMVDMNSEKALEFARKGQALTRTIERLPQIVIASVQGFALGGGCELAMACDLIIASKSAKFGQPEVNLGLIPGFGGTQRLIKRVGLPVAMDMLLAGRGRTLSAEEAFALGLVSRVVADDQLETETSQVITAILKCAPQAVAETKQLARAALEMSLDAGLNSEALGFANCFGRGEAKEGMSAFIEKRSPNFKETL